MLENAAITRNFHFIHRNKPSKLDNEIRTIVSYFLLCCTPRTPPSTSGGPHPERRTCLWPLWLFLWQGQKRERRKRSSLATAWKPETKFLPSTRNPLKLRLVRPRQRHSRRERVKQRSNSPSTLPTRQSTFTHTRASYVCTQTPRVFKHIFDLW